MVSYNRHKIKIPIESIVSLYERTGSVAETARILGCSGPNVSYRLRKANIVTAQSKKLPTDEIIRGDYLKCGVKALSKKYGVDITCVRKNLVRQGILDSARGFIKSSHVSRKARDRRKRFEFKDSTKKCTFNEQNGLCGECNKLVGPNWRYGVYHHILPVWKGGTGERENCLLMCKRCHNDPIIFKRLHGFSIGRLGFEVERGF